MSLFTGFLATTGVVLHEFPEGIVTYLMLVRSGFGERRAAQLAFLVAAATTPPGMPVSYPFIQRIDGAALGRLLGLSAGTLVYVGATHPLPRVEKEQKNFSRVALAGGVAVALVEVASKR